ncbi:MAG: TetR/AcrR family transcriptional regulator [Treponema sp.]|uniref:TetR/AcrR family transcriptional regulator n=1 Tax=Treponema sp. TaxID=166 RepID=UPI001B46D33A|nr:TetR/AcrR family transcriptional regulator [Treponema sp.]MBP5402964.1 TetR/AcrR family transcriptional regulator [Treponema sp.]MBR5932824.1 TetR/AcrR family transcriptional regulator [Treponema sp.]
MSRPLITQEKIIEAALFCAFDKGMGDTSLNDISNYLSIKKASLYNHFTSKEEMLKAINLYCSDFYLKVNFVSDDELSKAGASSSQAEKVFKQCSVNYIKKHEVDPLFQIYTFVNSEKYFNKEVLDIYNNQIAKIENQIYLFYKLISSNSENAELRRESKLFCNVLMNVLDTYLASRKEIIRQNPESGVGALFALPSDDKFMQEFSKIAENSIKRFSK